MTRPESDQPGTNIWLLNAFSSRLSQGVRRFGWLFVANVVYFASQWLLLITITRQLGLAELGRFSLALSIYGPLILFAGLQLRPLFLSDPSAERNFSQYLATRIALVSIVWISVTLGAGLFLRGEVVLVLLVGGLRSFEAVSDLCYGRFQLDGRYWQVAKSQMRRGIAMAMGGFAGGLWGGSVEWVALIALSVAGLGTVMDLLALHSAISRVRAPDVWKMTKRAAPLGIVACLLSLSTSLPVYVLGISRTSAEVGVFAALASFIVVGSSAIMAAGQVVAPSFARFRDANHRIAFERILSRMLAFAASLGIIGVLLALVIGELVLSLTFGKQVASDSHLLVPMMAVGGLAYASAMLRQALIALGLHTHQLVVLSCASAVLGIAALAMIPVWGVGGAIGAAASGLSAQVAGLTLIYLRYGRSKLTQVAVVAT